MLNNLKVSYVSDDTMNLAENISDNTAKYKSLYEQTFHGTLAHISNSLYNIVTE